MLGQVLRRRRLFPLREIGRSADDGHAHVRPDAHGDHVLGHLFAEPDAGVEASLDNVGQSVFDDDFDIDLRIIRQQLLQRGPEDGFGRVFGCVDADGAGGLFAQFRQRGQFRFDLVEMRPDRRQQAFAGGGGRDAAGGARQQAKPQPFLEPPDRMAQRRLRHPEPGCGPGEAAFARDGEKGDQVVGVGR